MGMKKLNSEMSTWRARFIRHAGDIKKYGIKSVIKQINYQIKSKRPVDYDKWIRKVSCPGDVLCLRDVGHVFMQNDDLVEITILDTSIVLFGNKEGKWTADSIGKIKEVLENNPNISFLYSDEDNYDRSNDKYFDPQMKPDYNPDLLRSMNYIGKAFAVKTDFLKKIIDKLLQEEITYENDTYYELILRCVEILEKEDLGKTLSEESERLLKAGRYTSERIYHIGEVLYHRYVDGHEEEENTGSGIRGEATKQGTRNNTFSFLKMHCQRMGYEIKDVVPGEYPGISHIIYETVNPLISVVIPNKDHAKDLDKVIRSVSKGDYDNLEFVIVENNSTEDETWTYYENIQKEFSNVRVVKWDGTFNYSAINNFGVKFAKGEYLLFINNDIEQIKDESVREMLMYAQRMDVGICGAKLLYNDRTIQHAGVLVGKGGIAGAYFVGHPVDNPTYMHRGECAGEYSAVTAAVMMCKKDVFERVGGFSEDLAVAFNDIDFCLKVRALGLKVVYTPYALYFHYESKSRGNEDSKEKIKRFNNEIETFAKKWPDIVKNGDPYYNQNLTLREADYSLRNLAIEQIGDMYPNEVVINCLKNMEEQ